MYVLAGGYIRLYQSDFLWDTIFKYGMNGMEILLQKYHYVKNTRNIQLQTNNTKYKTLINVDVVTLFCFVKRFSTTKGIVLAFTIPSRVDWSKKGHPCPVTFFYK